MNAPLAFDIKKDSGKASSMTMTMKKNVSPPCSESLFL